MNIPIESVAKAVNKGILPQVYIAMKVIEDGCNYLFPQDYFYGLDNNMYINDKLTQKGIKLLEEIEGVKEVSNKIDNKYELLHKKLQTILKEKTGTAKYKVEGKWAFLQNPTDLKEKIEKCVKRYKLTDFDKIEKLLLNYTETACNKKFEKMQLLQYYILREKPEISSSLATDYSNFEEKEEEVKKEELTNTKELF